MFVIGFITDMMICTFSHSDQNGTSHCDSITYNLGKSAEVLKNTEMDVSSPVRSR